MKDDNHFETQGCSCVDVGTLIQEEDTRLEMTFSGAQADETFNRLKARAQAIGSGQCRVAMETLDQDGAPCIRAVFDFDCAAEKLIFQMSQR